ncbi:ketosynthase chain-length factor [Amycolatopsis decaplanina]|uniref:Beta-ketoacyl synthase n=2 Tax=Amycolatopsis decaplanina TaxID=208441 RepID=M2Z9N4_9PSEU|nr:ketosynthase chain-length factor [Amycolatopsis decaplanina]EME57643.1 beta-ketoacyl synthase [Amycolatopsis decaplanina DSM 44594]
MSTGVRAVITGIGVVAPNGLSTEDYWSATVKGRSGLDRINRFEPSRYPVRVAGEISSFTPEEHLPNRLLPQTDRVTQLALTASDSALRDAGLSTETLPDYAMGVVTSTAAGGFEFGQGELAKLWGKGPRFVSAYQSFAWFYAVNTGQISIRHGLRGHSTAVVTEQAGGLDSIGHARRLLRSGAMISAVTGGADSLQCPWGLVAQLPNGRLSHREDPRTAYLPFSAEASGYVPGEGGAILVMEDLVMARERGAPTIYGEVAGYSATFDPPPGSGRPGTLVKAIETALSDADVEPSSVGVVFADAVGVPESDDAEARAIRSIFGRHGVPVTAPKSMTGRLYAGGSALDVATALLALGARVVPPTIGTEHVSADYGIDLVAGGSRPLHGHHAMVISRGAKGFNSVMVLRKG